MNIEEYIESINTPEDEVLAAMRKETHQVTLHPRMLSGNIQGKLLQYICEMLKPKQILEIGTYTAYSTISMARGISDDAKITTLEKNDEILWLAEKYIKKANVENKINLVLCDAVEYLNNSTEKFDLVFIDGDKREYIKYFNAVIDKIEKGGFIIVDNVLWANKVLEKAKNTDKQLIGIQEFNKYISENNRVEQIILPFRDGLMFIKKL